MKELKPVHYHGYIYWILMILGIFVGNLFDKVDKGMILCILFIVGFEICGDAISQLII